MCPYFRKSTLLMLDKGSKMKARSEITLTQSHGDQRGAITSRVSMFGIGHISFVNILTAKEDQNFVKHALDTQPCYYCCCGIVNENT